MSAVVLVHEWPCHQLYCVVTLRDCPTPPFTLSRISTHLSLPDLVFLASPRGLKQQASLSALADILLCCVNYEMLTMQEQRKVFTDLLVRNYVMGIKHVVVCVDEQSTTGIALTSEVFSELSSEIHSQFRKVGLGGNGHIVPISLQRNINIHGRSSEFQWYTGPCVLETVGSIELPARPKGAFVFLVRDTFQRGGTVVCCGRVARGAVAVGDIVAVAPGARTGKVVSIGCFGELVASATAGQLCGIGLADVHRRDIHKGSVLSSPSKPCGDVAAFETQQISLFKVIKWSSEATMFTHCAAVPIRIQRIIQKIDRRTRNVICDLPLKIDYGESCLLLAVPKKPVALQVFSEAPFLGRIILTSSGKCESVGIVRSITASRTYLSQ